MEGRGNAHMSKAKKTAKKNPKRTASASLRKSFIIADDALEPKLDSVPRPVEDDHQRI